MAFIVTRSATKPALIPISIKLYGNNFNTWRHQVWLTIQTIGMKDHLDGLKILPKYAKTKSFTFAEIAASTTSFESALITPQQSNLLHKLWKSKILSKN
ncbi:hypothetical protein AHAS_Ahas16G0168500 [Arachis hypogaea]